MLRGRSSCLRAHEAYHEAVTKRPQFPDALAVAYLSVASPHTLSNARKPKRFQGYARAGWQQKFNISERLEDLRREHEALRWEGSFRDYFELVAQNPRIAQLSHARINDMVHAAGVERLNEGTTRSPLLQLLFHRTIRHRRADRQNRRVLQVRGPAS